MLMNGKNMFDPRSMLLLQQLEIFTACLQILANATEFLVINANLRKIAFGTAIARKIQYMGEQY